jgi:hypothetical protein
MKENKTKTLEYKCSPEEAKEIEDQLNTQEIQEWSKEFDEKFKPIWLIWNAFMNKDREFKIDASPELSIKSFISQKLKEQEERHKREKTKPFRS